MLIFVVWIIFKFTEGFFGFHAVLVEFSYAVIADSFSLAEFFSILAALVPAVAAFNWLIFAFTCGFPELGLGSEHAHSS